MNDEPHDTEYRPSDRSARKSSPSATAKRRESLDLQDRQLGDFRILRRLGKGGMAEVYLAEQTSLKRQVAVKVLQADLLDEKDTVLIRRFEQEASAAGGLSHPNIVQVYMVGEQEGIHYIAQEYVQGPNLKDYIRKKGPLDLTVGLHIMRQTAAALQAAGDAGIVHRDIKPENIMLTRKGEVKVADFGLAQLSTSKEGSHLTQVGMTMGTPLYMSPEQINGKKVDHRSDIYSLGVTYFYLLTGRAPFEGETPLSIAVKHLNEPPPRISEIRSDLPQILVDLVFRMMSKLPEKRIASAGDVVQALKRIAKQLREDPDDPQLRPETFDVSSASEKRGGGGWLTSVALFCLCSMLVFGASAGLGWLLRTPDPLKSPAPADARSTIPVADNAEQQFIRASMAGTSDEWQVVIDNFGTDPMVYRAKAQLALALLREGRRPEAEEIFEEFRLKGATNQTYEAIGLAGQAILAYRDGNFSESYALLQKVDPALIVDIQLLWENLQMLQQKVSERLQEQQRKNSNELFNENVGTT